MASLLFRLDGCQRLSTSADDDCNKLPLKRQSERVSFRPRKRIKAIQASPGAFAGTAPLTKLLRRSQAILRVGWFSPGMTEAGYEAMTILADETVFKTGGFPDE
jgi:hypothetical protein